MTKVKPSRNLSKCAGWIAPAGWRVCERASESQTFFFAEAGRRLVARSPMRDPDREHFFSRLGFRLDGAHWPVQRGCERSHRGRGTECDLRRPRWSNSPDRNGGGSCDLNDCLRGVLPSCATGRFAHRTQIAPRKCLAALAAQPRTEGLGINETPLLSKPSASGAKSRQALRIRDAAKLV